MQTENEAYVELLCRHLADMIQRLRTIPAEQWDWTPAPSAPSPRIIAQHTWNWLVADRQHLQEPNVTQHLPIPDSPTDPEALCEALEAERDYWRETLPALTPEQLAEERFQFGMAPFGMRTLVTHITQQVIYKHGQLSTLYFALGLDGEAPYTAPYPNDDYARVAEMMQHPLHHAILSDDIAGLRAALTQSKDDLFLSVAGHTPLKLAVMRNRPEIVALLLQAGADGDETDSDQNTALVGASFYGYTQVAEVLLQHGVDVHRANRWNGTPLGFARMQNHQEIATLLEQAGATH